MWANFRAEQVFRVDPLHMFRSGLHWVLSLLSGGFLLSPPKSMLDNTPAARAARDAASTGRGVRTSIERGHLRALALCATSYVTGQSVAFYDGRDTIQRLGARAARRAGARR